MYFDWTYLVYVMPAVIFAMIASARVNSTYKRYSGVFSQRGITAENAARTVLDANGLNNVEIRQIAGNLTDRFDPSNNVVSLSEGVYNSTSIAAIGIALHEVGHALQHAQGYLPIKIRTAIVPITNFGSQLSVPLIILGIILSSFSQQLVMIAYIGILLYALCVVFQLVTLPTEFNASKRAMESIKEYGFLSEEEAVGTRRVLSAAAMTYVASLAVTIMQLLRFIVLVCGRRNNR